MVEDIERRAGVFTKTDFLEIRKEEFAQNAPRTYTPRLRPNPSTVALVRSNNYYRDHEIQIPYLSNIIYTHTHIRKNRPSFSVIESEILLRNVLKMETRAPD